MNPSVETVYILEMSLHYGKLISSTHQVGDVLGYACMNHFEALIEYESITSAEFRERQSASEE